MKTQAEYGMNDLSDLKVRHEKSIESLATRDLLMRKTHRKYKKLLSLARGPIGLPGSAAYVAWQTALAYKAAMKAKYSTAHVIPWLDWFDK